MIGAHEGQPVTRTKTKAWDAAVKRAGCPEGLRWHDLRHTWATWHAMAETPLEVLRELGGWASMDMVQRYSHFSPGHLAQYAGRVARGGHEIGHSVSEDDANPLIIGVADGIRTHDNRNHKPTRDNVLPLNQAVTEPSAPKRRVRKA